MDQDSFGKNRNKSIRCPLFEIPAFVFPILQALFGGDLGEDLLFYDDPTLILRSSYDQLAFKRSAFWRHASVILSLLINFVVFILFDGRS